MNKALAILAKFPQADPLADFTVQDMGNGQYISQWNVKDSSGQDVPQPSDDDLSAWWIDALKLQKIAEFNALCNQTILGGFTSSATGTAHQYPFDMEAQSNMNQELSLMNVDSTITSVDWKTEDAGVISHTKAQFIQLCQDAKAFKTEQITKYWTLKQQVVAATTEDTVNAFAW